MSRTGLPKAHYMPWAGQYRPMYRWYVDVPFTLVPGGQSYPTAQQAIDAADAHMAGALNKQIRAEKPEARDVLGLTQWHVDRAARSAAEQEQALGAVIVRGRQVKVERRKERA